MVFDSLLKGFGPLVLSQSLIERNGEGLGCASGHVGRLDGGLKGGDGEKVIQDIGRRQAVLWLGDDLSKTPAKS